MSQKLPSKTAREVIRALGRKGFVLERQSGSHAIYRHPDGRWTTVPIHGKRDSKNRLMKKMTVAAMRSVVARRFIRSSCA